MASTNWIHDGDLRSVAEHLVTCASCHEGRSRLIGNARAEDIEKIARGYLELLRMQTDLHQDRCENAWVEVSLYDEAKRVIHELNPAHPFLSRPAISYGVWEKLNRRIVELEAALRDPVR